MGVLLPALAVIFVLLAITSGMFAYRIATAPRAAYERNRVKSLRGSLLTESEIDEVLRR